MQNSTTKHLNPAHPGAMLPYQRTLSKLIVQRILSTPTYRHHNSNPAKCIDVALELPYEMVGTHS